MTAEKLSFLFEKNADFLELPIKIETGKDVWDTLHDRWKRYTDWLSEIECLRGCLPIVKSSISLIDKALDAYYSGDYAVANSNMVQLIGALQNANSHLIINDLRSYYIDTEYGQWFRARIGDSFPFSKAEMGHIPADKRGNIGSSRYSSNGIPCLYIGNSIYACWEELNRPPIHELWVSRFWPVHSLRVINLSITGRELIDAPMYLKHVGDSSAEYNQAVAEFFSTWILQSACSVKVKEQRRVFREEYVVPQLLAQSLKKYDLDGVMYFSTSVPNVYSTPCTWISKVLAIPAFDLKGEQYSERINRLFCNSYPINIGMFQQRLIAPRPPVRCLDENGARKGAVVFTSPIGSVYNRTIFYDCECELLQEPYGIDLKNAPNVL